MKQITFILLTLLMLVGCGSEGQTLSTNDGEKNASEPKGKKKLDAEEKLAMDFYSQLVLGTKEEQQKFFDKRVHTEGKLFYTSLVGSPSVEAENQNPTVIESIEKEKDGEKMKSVLMQVSDSNDQIREVLLVFSPENKEYKLMVSTTSDTEDEESKEMFNAIRTEFKAKVPAEITEREEEQAAQTANVEVAEQKLYSWKDSIDSIWVHYAAEIKNTGNATATIGSIQVNYIGKDGSILGTSPMISVLPDVIMPGETAYIGESTIVETVDNPEDVVDATINIDFTKTSEEPMFLETENVNFKEVKDGFSSPYIVTGTVKNPMDNLADDIRLAAGLYDANGKLVAVQNGSIDISLNSGSTAGFELNYPEIPEETHGQVTSVKVKAYNWSW